MLEERGHSTDEMIVAEVKKNKTKTRTSGRSDRAVTITMTYTTSDNTHRENMPHRHDQNHSPVSIAARYNKLPCSYAWSDLYFTLTITD